MISSRSSLYRKLFFPVLILILLSSGCSNKKQIRGKGVVPGEIMVEMMVEMHLIDGLTNDVTFYRKYNPNDSIDLYGLVYEKYEVSKKDFHTTLQEYASIPGLLDQLYGEVLKELNLMQEELDRKQEVELDKKKRGKQPDELPKDVERRSKDRSGELRPEK